METNLPKNHEVAVQSLPLLSGLSILCCCELWCRSQTWLRSVIAVAAVAPISPLAQQPPYAVTAALKSKKKKKRLNICYNFLLGSFWLLIQSPYSLLLCLDCLFFFLNHDSVLENCMFLKIYQFLLGYLICWCLIVPNCLLWPFLFLWYPLWCLLFHL